MSEVNPIIQSVHSRLREAAFYNEGLIRLLHEYANDAYGTNDLDTALPLHTALLALGSTMLIINNPFNSTLNNKQLTNKKLEYLQMRRRFIESMTPAIAHLSTIINSINDSVKCQEYVSNSLGGNESFAALLLLKPRQLSEMWGSSIGLIGEATGRYVLRNRLPNFSYFQQYNPNLDLYNRVDDIVIQSNEGKKKFVNIQYKGENTTNSNKRGISILNVSNSTDTSYDLLVKVQHLYALVPISYINEIKYS